MALSDKHLNREHDKFTTDSSGDTAVNTVNEALTDTWDAVSSSIRMEEIDPIYGNHVELTLANTSGGGGAATTGTYYVDMDGFRTVSFQLYASGPTSENGFIKFTAQITNQDDGTAAASCLYSEATSALFGVSEACATGQAAGTTIVDTFWRHTDPLACKYLKLTVVATASSTDWEWLIYSKKLY